MHHLLEAMTRWLAPILSFTTDEIWSYMPGRRSESVFLETWCEIPALSDDASRTGLTLADWDQILAVRQAVGRELETLRVAGGIGSSLDAEVDLYCGDDLREQLVRLGEELRFVFITSYARVHPASERRTDSVDTDVPGLGVSVAASDHPKCVRCWHHRVDVGSHADHPLLCGRCVENLGKGEAREFA